MTRFPTAALFLFATGAQAATFTVTRFDDPAPGVCDGDCSLREAIRAANSAAGPDTVVLPAGTFTLSRTGLDDVADVGDLDIQGSITIAGAGAQLSTINSNGLYRVFHIDPEGDGNLTVEIRDLAIVNASDNFGGAILNLANTTLERVSIRDSVADAGGAILTQRPLVVRSSTLSDNSVRTGGYGGAIWAQGGASVQIAGTTVSGNSAHIGGGGMALFASTAIVEDGSVFDSNVAVGGGGGVVLLDGSTLTVTGSTFTGNRGDDGGAVAVQGNSQATFISSTLAANQAVGLDFGGGGAIFLFDGGIVATGTNFDDNVALGEGGGAVLIAGATLGTMTMTGGRFMGNRAESHAGPLPGSTPGLGGAVLVIAGSNASFNGTTFISNLAALAGGAAYNDRVAALTLEDAGLAGNSATTRIGGAIASEGDLTIRRSTFTGNTALLAGGAIAASRELILIEDSEFADNDAQNAGALASSDGGRLVVRRSAFIGNDATGPNPRGLGGAILLEPAVGETLPISEIENTTFHANGARDGAVAGLGSAGNSTLRFVHSTLADNTTAGGTSLVAGASGTFQFKASILAANCSLQGTYTTLGRNLESPGNTCRLAGIDMANVSSGALALSALAGTPPRFREPAQSSVARDFVPVVNCTDAAGAPLAHDQRNLARPFGPACDAGAIERQPVDPIFANGFE